MPLPESSDRDLRAIEGLRARLDRAERDIQDLIREATAHQALTAHEYRELRDEGYRVIAQLRSDIGAIEAQLDRLKVWAIGLLIMLVLNLVSILVANLGKTLTWQSFGLR